jgi:hypothetical protein
MKVTVDGYLLLRNLAVIMIAVVVMVPVAVVAPSPCIFQVTTAILRLSAMFPVLAFLIVQLTLRIADSLLALSVIVTAMVNKRPCGHCSAQERQNNKGRNECLGFLQHASSSDCHTHLISWMHLPGTDNGMD